MCKYWIFISCLGIYNGSRGRSIDGDLMSTNFFIDKFLPAKYTDWIEIVLLTKSYLTLSERFRQWSQCYFLFFSKYLSIKVLFFSVREML